MAKNKGIYRIFRTKEEFDRYEQRLRHLTRMHFADHITCALGRMGFREAKFRELDRVLTEVCKEYATEFLEDFKDDKEMVYSRHQMEKELKQWTGNFYVPEEERYKY